MEFVPPLPHRLLRKMIHFCLFMPLLADITCNAMHLSYVFHIYIHHFIFFFLRR
uniref:Uncharacterized protein n=1 Tax=Anguilla anguilla TaxID=7936 RepID=A0A0E9VRU5_ANGAN